MNESRSIPTATSFRTARGRPARRPAQGAQGRRQEALLHPPDRLGDRPGLATTCPVMAHCLSGGRRQAAARRSRASISPRPGRRRRAQGRHALAGRARCSRSADTMTSRSFVAALRRARRRRARQQAAAGRLRRREHLAHQPGRPRHGRLGAAADAGPGHDHRHRLDRLPARASADADPSPLRELGVSKVMTMTSHLRPPRDPGRRVGRVPAPDRRSCSRARTASTTTVFGALGVSETTAPRTLPSRLPIRCPPRSRRRVTPGGQRADEALLQAVQAATSVVKAHRMHGHLAARLDPLGTPPRGDPALDPATVNLTPELMRAIPAAVLRVAVPGDTFADALPHLQETYCGTIAYEIEHISDHEQRVWLRQTIESRRAYRIRARTRAEAHAARPPVRGRGARELPAQGVPREEAVLDRGPRHAGADARRD